MLNTLFIREERSVAEPMSDSPFGRIIPAPAHVEDNTSSTVRATMYLAGIVRLRVQVAQWTDEQPDTELSRLPIPA